MALVACCTELAHHAQRRRR